MTDWKVLVVDDEPTVRELVARFLEFDDYEALTASNGEEGLKLLYEHEVDLVISDIIMPVMDGHEFCRLVRKVSDVPILMLSGQVNLEDEQQKLLRLNNNIDAFLSKPLSMNEFLNTVKSLLSKERSSGLPISLPSYGAS